MLRVRVELLAGVPLLVPPEAPPTTELASVTLPTVERIEVAEVWASVRLCLLAEEGSVPGLPAESPPMMSLPLVDVPLPRVTTPFGNNKLLPPATLIAPS